MNCCYQINDRKDAKPQRFLSVFALPNLNGHKEAQDAQRLSAIGFLGLSSLRLRVFAVKINGVGRER